MPAPLPLTVTLITLNEESHIEAALRSVTWADEILVVDSGSTDRTIEIATRMGARVLTNPWPGYGMQKNFAQDHAKYDWVLNIDADERVPAGLKDELFATLTAVAKGTEPARAFALPRKTFYLGRWIRHGGWYPNYLVRFAHRKHARWTEPAVHEEWKLTDQAVAQGIPPAKRLVEPLEHFTFSDIQDQILTNLNFSRLGYLDLKRKGTRPSLFRLILKPIGKFLETFLIKKGFLDGLPGFIISINAAHSMFLKYAYLFEHENSGPRQ